jgi:uncharacterized membrane protein (TIGR02234 family)
VRRRARLIAVLVILAAAALGVISSTQVWLSATLRDGASEPLQVAGADAVALLTPLNLAALALGAALSIAGPILRYAFGVLCALIGGALLALVWPVVVDPPVQSVAAAVTEATGITGIGAVSDLVSGIAATPWPAISLVCGMLLLAAGAFVLATAHHWAASDRRYRTGPAPRDANAASSRPHDAIDSWDDLSRGEDPTSSTR